MSQNKYWFKTKEYGWGFVPVTWEGWLATLVLLTLILISVHTNGFFNGFITGEEALRFIFDAFLLATIFAIVMKSRTKGTLKWYRVQKRRKKRKQK